MACRLLSSCGVRAPEHTGSLLQHTGFSLVAAHVLSSCGMWAPEHMGSVVVVWVPEHMGM